MKLLCEYGNGEWFALSASADGKVLTGEAIRLNTELYEKQHKSFIERRDHADKNGVFFPTRELAPLSDPAHWQYFVMDVPDWPDIGDG